MTAVAKDVMPTNFNNQEGNNFDFFSVPVGLFAAKTIIFFWFLSAMY